MRAHLIPNPNPWPARVSDYPTCLLFPRPASRRLLRFAFAGVVTFKFVPRLNCCCHIDHKAHLLSEPGRWCHGGACLGDRQHACASLRAATSCRPIPPAPSSSFFASSWESREHRAGSLARAVACASTPADCRHVDRADQMRCQIL